MTTYQITRAHTDLSGAESFNNKAATFPNPVSREGLLKHAEYHEIEAVIQSLTNDLGSLDMDDLQGVCQRFERLGLWVTRDQVSDFLK